MVYGVLSGKVHIKDPLLLMQKCVCVLVCVCMCVVLVWYVCGMYVLVVCWERDVAQR